VDGGVHLSVLNDLPDSSFLHVEGGGKKDEDGKTVPRTLRHFPYKDANGNVDLPHLRNALARIPQSSLAADLKSRLTSKAQGILEKQSARSTIFTDSFVRAASFDFDLQRTKGNGKAIMSGRLASFGDWTEIDSPFEGHFMERIAPGAFAKTIQENGQKLKVLFQHGLDPAIGKKPLGRILDLAEDAQGVRYEVELLDAPYVDDLIPGLEAGLYGTSFRARDIKNDETRWPKRSDFNPKRLPEVTRLELEMKEFGPVTFPAYADTTARMRSMTDEFMLPGLRELIAALRPEDVERAAALTEPEPEPEEETPESTPAPEVSRSTRPRHDYLEGKEEKPSWHL
jgi:hypothetical protein